MEIALTFIGILLFNTSYVYLHIAGFSKRTKIILMAIGNVVLIGYAIILFIKKYLM